MLSKKEKDTLVILSATTIIKSPGIPDKAPIIKKLKEKNIEIISEIEFAFRYSSAKVIAITALTVKQPQRH